MSSVYEDMSAPEKQVADFLSSIGLWWRYEHPVFVYDKKERPRLWTPDFFLPKIGIFIEVCGSGEIDYFYREEVYEKNDLNVIFVHQYKAEKWQSFLLERIIQIENSRHQKIMSIIESIRSSLDKAT